MTGSPALGFEALIHPMHAAVFAEEWWGRHSLVLNGAEDRFAGLVGSADVGRILQYAKPRPPRQMLLVKGSRHCDVNWTNPDGSPRPDRVRAAWQDGYSVVLNDMAGFWEPVARFCAALTADLHHPVNANLYLTPPDTQAFDPHYDIMDVFVLQIEGSKHWEVRGPARDLPMPDEHAAVDPTRLPDLVWNGELTPGSVLYIPRGHVHAARATAQHSLHLTIGVSVITWLDLLTAAVASARQDARYRAALPPGFLRGGSALADALAALAPDLQRFLTLDDGLAGVGRTLLAAPPPPREDLFAEPAEPALDTALRLRTGVFGQVGVRGGLAVFQYSGGVIAAPQKTAAALQHVVSACTWTPRDLPGALGDNERLVLARRLLRDGIVEAAPC